MGSLGVILALLLAACTATESPPDVPEQPAYTDVVELFDRGIARTCSLNGGVCHNSNNYPDLHTVSNVIATVGRECNVETPTPADIHDACEPPADHLLVAAADARIVASTITADRTRATLALDAPIAAATLAPIQVVRGTRTFDLGARIASVDGMTVTIELRTDAAKAFFDIRTYPVGPQQLHVGDPNGNGIQGALVAAMPLVTPGDPDRSYLLRRLIDESYGELMPRQCRTWDDRANQALACWIAGLAPDASNAYAPIDYTTCAVDVKGLGKCETSDLTGYARIAQIFTRSCAGTGCHINEDAPAGKLDLGDAAYGALVEVRSSAVAMPRVTPGDPDASYLWCKIAGSCAARIGARMPLDAPPLSDDDLAAIRAWIEAGAPR